jgi:hypothetical protein
VQPLGPAAGFVNAAYAFRTVSTDPEHDSVSYQFRWSRGDTSAWSTFLCSKESKSAIGNSGIQERNTTARRTQLMKKGDFKVQSEPEHFDFCNL